MNKENFYDVIIIGAGIVGLTLAHQLKNSILKIAVIDKQLPTHPGGETAALRMSAITPASQKILADLSLWQSDISAFNKMYVWTPEGSYLEFDSAEINVPALGYIVQNCLLHTGLYEALRNNNNIAFITPAQLQALNYATNNVEVVTDAGTFNTTLLIGADGANSLVRELSNIDLVQQDYQHSGIVATVKTELPHQQTAWQCFLATGPLAFLPMLEAHTASIVWSIDPMQAERLLKLDDQTFCAELAKAFNYRLGNVTEISQRLSFPLQRRHAKHYVKANVALIGDAAHTIHPLAGQGLNLGILDAACLAATILTAQQQQRSIGSIATLRKYERARKADNSLMFAVVDALKRLFASPLLPVKFLRNTGLNVVNNFTLLKKYLIKQAIGNRE